MGDEAMADGLVRDDLAPQPFVNTVTPPRWLGTVGMILVTALGLLLLWVVSLNPIFGRPLNGPVSLTMAGLIVLVGAGGVASFWWQADEAWRKVPDGPLSPEFRKLADAGREFEAVERLRAETGAGWYEARQVLKLYLADRRGDQVP